MSLFSGIFPLLPGIKCDRFDELEVEPKVEQFFLSHCHEDHMKGESRVSVVVTRPTCPIVTEDWF